MLSRKVLSIYSIMRQEQKHSNGDAYTQAVPAPPGCMFIMITAVCYSWMKCKIIYQFLGSAQRFLSSPLLSPSPAPSIHSQLSYLFISFISAQLLVFLSRVLTCSFLIVPSLSFSQSIFQGHGIFPWVFAHKIISCWQAGPAVELIASNADNRDKGKGGEALITFGFSQINSLD